MVDGDTFDPSRVTWVLDEGALARLCTVLAEATEAAFDLETTGLDEHKPTAKIALASYTIGADTWLLPLYHPESPWLGRWRSAYSRTIETIREERTRLIAHNGKFDARWTYAMTGLDVAPLLVWDTEIAEHLLDENRSRKLKEAAPRTFGIGRWDDVDLSYDDAALDIPLIDLGLYAARDTYWTWQLAMWQRVQMVPDDQPFDSEEIEAARLGNLLRNVSMPTTRTLTRVEQRGIALDVEWTRERLWTEQSEFGELAEKLVTRYGYAYVEGDWSFAPTSHWFQGWTEKAVAAGDLQVAAMTKTGKPQWSRQVLTRQARAGSEVAQMLLGLRGASKRSEYLQSWLDNEWHGIIYANYNVGSIVTGRLSSSAPNMQQVTKALRPAFIPRPGYVMADLDFSQIELRVAAYIAKCQPMIEAFKRGDDLHRMIAAETTRKPPEEVTADERQSGKAANFGYLFGQSAFGFREYAESAYGVSLTMEEAEASYNAFFSRWEGMAEWHAWAVNRAHQTGQVSSPLGRVRRVPGIHDGNPEMVHYSERAAINAPVQGMASDLMQIAAAAIEGTIVGARRVPEARIVATVHDSIVIEVPEDDWERVVRECMDRMVNLDYWLKRLDCGFDIPLEVEAACGTRWGLADIGEITS